MSESMGHFLETDVEGRTKALQMDNHVAALLAYLPIAPLNLLVPILWLATEPKESRFVRFHSAQSLLFQAAWFVILVAWLFVSGILGAILSMAFGGMVGATVSMIFGLVTLAWFVVGLVGLIMGMVRAYQRVAWHMPLVGEWSERLVVPPEADQS